MNISEAIEIKHAPSAEITELEFTECELSGHLKADGRKGQYWIFDMTWAYLSRVTVDYAGPNSEKLGAHFSINDAIEAANIEDQREEDQ